MLPFIPVIAVHITIGLHICYGLLLSVVATRLLTLRKQLQMSQPMLVQHAMLTCAFAFVMSAFTIVSAVCPYGLARSALAMCGKY